MNFIIVAYYSNLLYSEYLASHLRYFAKQKGYMCDIVKIHSRGSFKKDKQYKPVFCRLMLEKHQIPILYIDLDIFFDQVPDVSVNIYQDICFLNIDGKITTEIMYIQPSLDSFIFLELWASMLYKSITSKKNGQIFDGSDDEYARMALSCNSNNNLNIGNIFCNYTKRNWNPSDNEEISISFFVTAIKRDEVFCKTLESFVKNINGISFKNSVINIFFDTAYGDRIDKSISFASEIFRETYVIKNNFQNYSSNLKKCLEFVVDDFSFYFQDDYEVIKNFHVSDFINPLLINKNKIATLGRVDYSGSIVARTGPCLITKSYAYKMMNLLNEKENPNISLHNNQESGDVLDGYFSGFPLSKSPIYFKENGTEYMLKNGYTRNSHSNFLYWEKS